MADPGDSSPSAGCGGEPLVFLLAGQSNMSGQAHARDLPRDWRAPPCVELYDNGRARPLVPTGHGRHATFGPELGFADAIADALPGRVVLLVKRAVGGTSLAKDWDPDRGDGLFAALVDDYRDATADRPHRLVAALWSQGGADSQAREPAEAYEARLTTFITRLREAVRAPALPFILSGARPEDPQTAQMQRRYPFLTTVRAANIAVSERLPGAYLVLTSGLHYSRDGRHLDAPGQLEFGQRFAAMVLDRVPDELEPTAAVPTSAAPTSPE